MVADDLLTRQRYREVPPRVDYELTERARDLLPVIGALARWGYRWAWGAPGADEAIDVGAILRCMTGFVPPAALDGTIEITVRRPSGELKRYTLARDEDEIAIEEHSAPDADARIVGSERAWVEALGPMASTDALDISGDESLADSLLGALRADVAREAALT